MEMDLKKKVEVVNNTRGVVSYRVDNVKRRWTGLGEKKLIPVEELQSVLFTQGGLELFQNSELLIKDKEVREYLGLTTETAYLIDPKEAKRLLERPIEEINAVMEKAPMSIKRLIANVAIESDLSDLRKIEAISKHSKVNVHHSIVLKRDAANEPPVPNDNIKPLK